MVRILDALNARMKNTPAMKKADAAIKTFVKTGN